MDSILPFSNNIDILKQPVSTGSLNISNRLIIQPMEGCDGEPDGSPGEMTIRRYHRFADGGAGLIWFEATAVSNESRANPRQLYLHEGNADRFAQLVDECKKRSQGVPMIMQATHSGRYSRPNAKPEPIISHNIPLYEKEPLPSECIISDDNLDRLVDDFVATSKLALRVGFDGIDIKACHGYLLSELLAAHTRRGRYGGSFENRTRLMRNIVAAVRAALPASFTVTTRMNIYDGFPLPYGFGVNENGTPDTFEAIELLKLLSFNIVNITMGNPYQNPQVNRPVTIKAVELMYSLTKEIQQALPEVTVISSGPTFLGKDSGRLSVGAVEQGYCSLVGFGRMTFAYPDFAKDLLSKELNDKKLCVTCGKCTQLMRTGNITGCVVRDPIYTQLYKKVSA